MAPSPRRRIKRVDVRYLSLCHRGANRLPVIMKGDGFVEVDILFKETKEFDKTGELIICAYAKGLVDSDGDVADEPEAIRSMIHSHARNGSALDINHNGKALTREQAYLAESFTIQKGDPRFADMKDSEGNPVDVTGGWGGVLVVEDTSLREKYRSSDWNGVSIGGPAELEPLQKSELPTEEMFRELLTRIDAGVPLSPKPGDEMSPDEIKALLAANNQLLIEGLAKVLAPPPQPTPSVPVEKVVEKSRTEQIREELLEKAAERIMEEADLDDPEALQKALTSIEALTAKKSSRPARSNLRNPISSRQEDEDRETRALRIAFNAARGNMGGMTGAIEEMKQRMAGGK